MREMGADRAKREAHSERAGRPKKGAPIPVDWEAEAAAAMDRFKLLPWDWEELDAGQQGRLVAMAWEGQVREAYAQFEPFAPPDKEDVYKGKGGSSGSSRKTWVRGSID